MFVCFDLLHFCLHLVTLPFRDGGHGDRDLTLMMLLALYACCGCMIAMKSAHLHVKESVNDQSVTIPLSPSRSLCVAV